MKFLNFSGYEMNVNEFGEWCFERIVRERLNVFDLSNLSRSFANDVLLRATNREKEENRVTYSTRKKY